MGTDPNSKRSYRGGYNRGGIMFLGKNEGALKNLTFKNLTIRNCTYDGIFITGAEKLNVIGCDLNENGVSVAPGSRLLHNMHLSHCAAVSIKDSRMDTSPLGSGIVLNYCTNVSVANCEIARNGWHGISVTESKNIALTGNLIEANDFEGINIQYLYTGSENVVISNNIIHYNQGFGIIAYSGKNIKSTDNKFAGNGKDLKSDEKISTEKFIIMQ